MYAYFTHTFTHTLRTFDAHVGASHNIGTLSRTIQKVKETNADRLRQEYQDLQRYSIYLLYWYESTNTDAEGAASGLRGANIGAITDSFGGDPVDWVEAANEQV